MHIQVPTVRWISSVNKSLQWTRTLSDYDIKKLLLSDDRFSVEVACKYFEHYRKAWGFEWAVGMYNGGGIKNRKYIEKVKKKMVFTSKIR